MTKTQTKKIKTQIQNKETIDLNASEISVLSRRNFDFTNAAIIQKRGSIKSVNYSRETIEATGCTNFTLVFDLDAQRCL